VVFDDKRGFVAIGLWDPGSPIRIKILHTGRPVAIDRDFWTARITAALKLRRPLIDDPDNEGIRLIHGENDGLPGMVLDRYADTAVMKLYTMAWLPHLEALTGVIDEVVAPASLVVRTSRNIASRLPAGLAQGTALLGHGPVEPVMFLENGLWFEAHPITGQKTGYFLDQRDNRRMVRDLAVGCRVLDVFSYTGGFSVHAAAGGAGEVHSVDIAPTAVEAAARNMTHNSSDPMVAACRHTTTVGDAFDVMVTLARRGDQYDLVIIDPPSFAQRRADVAAARRAYRRLTSLALDLIGDGGTLVQASCSSRVTAEDFHRVVEETANSRGFRFDELARTGHGLDHPVGFAQGAYLKAVFVEVGRPRARTGSRGLFSRHGHHGRAR